MRSTIIAMLLLASPALARATDAVLVGALDVSPAIQYTDVWGWVDPATQRYYALVGNNATGMHIVDATDPTLPFEVSVVSTVPRFDMKTWGSLVYTVDGFNHPGGIVDITQPASPVVVGTFPGGHNIFIDTEGYLYVSLPGLRIYDLNDTPKQPQLVWEDAISDGFDGHDITVIGDMLYECRGSYGLRFWNVGDRSAPIPMGVITDSTIVYAHNCWPTEDGHYLFVTDEYALHPTPDISVWDISNMMAPRRVAEIFDSTSTVHNCYVIGDLLFTAYYTAGFRVYDIRDPRHPVLADTEDTSAYTGEGRFDGAFGCYPFSPDGYIYVNDRPNGLFIFRIDDVPTGVGGARVPPPILPLAAPNPFSGATVIRYTLAKPADVTVDIYDATGRRVRRLHAGALAAGEQRIFWDSRGDSGNRVPSGVYFCRVRAGGDVRTARLVLVR